VSLALCEATRGGNIDNAISQVRRRLDEDSTEGTDLGRTCYSAFPLFDALLGAKADALDIKLRQDLFQKEVGSAVDTV